jgi:hypothetical protein
MDAGGKGIKHLDKMLLVKDVTLGGIGNYSEKREEARRFSTSFGARG